MFEIVFNKVTVSKPNRYVLLLKTQQQTKRTDICSQWTSNPIFAPLPISQITSLQLKLCEATLDRKIRVVGTGTIPQQEAGENGIGFEGEVKLEQEVEGRMVCVGLVHLQIVRKKQYEAIPETTRKLKTQVSQVEGEDDDFELDLERTEEQGDEFSGDREGDEDAVRVQVHCGFNFYLGSEFYVEATWGNSSFRTRPIKDKISPVWAQGGRVTGRPSRPISLQVKDSKGNILESFKFSLASLRTLFPYHIRLVFREEYLGAIPELFFSLIRESPARHSVTERALTFGMRNIGEPTRNAMYLMVSLNEAPKVPLFMTLDRSQSCTLQQANTFLTQQTGGEEERVELVGLANNQTPKSLSLFKSFLSRKIHMSLLLIPDAKAWFAGRNWESSRVVDSRTDFETILKKVYYQGETFTIKKLLEFFNPNTIEEMDSPERSSAERWKLLTRNYILRSKMVNQCTAHIQDLKQAIQDKGAELVELKKILGKVKAVNFQLVGREKLMSFIRSKSRSIGKQMAKQIDTGALISALYQKQSILQGQKRINAELLLRMESLSQVQENQEDLSKELTANANKLLEQQQRISKMRSMEDAITQQRMIIGQLQRRFEKSEMDKRVNEALQQQRQRLDQLRQRKQEDLQKVYRIIKNNNQQGGGLHAKVKHAEETLVKLNEQYAKLTGL